MKSARSTFTLPAPPAPVHFVGIGGIGMSGLARILKSLGYEVTGSDSGASATTNALQREGIPVTIGHTATEHAAGAKLLVVSSAVPAHNPECDAALAAGVKIAKRAELLGALANARTCLAVAGSHGKSTTSGMLVSALNSLRANPSYAVGAVVATTGSNAAMGSGPVMVVEADEYDNSFLTLTPDIAIVTNIDFDHPDLFADGSAYDVAFTKFAAKIRPGGRLIVAGDDPGALRLVDAVKARTDLTIDTFGETAGLDWRVVSSATGWALARSSRERIELRIPVPGRHNARNAAAAFIALIGLGYHPNVAAAALQAFTGVGRRFDLKGEVGGVVVVDDYAHHPAEIRALLQAARERYPLRRIVAAFQPHTYSRTKAFLAGFASAFEGAHEVMVLDVFPSRETDPLGISSADLIALLPEGTVAGGSPTEAATRLAAIVQSNDLVLTIGAGDVTVVGPDLLARLAAQGVAGDG